MLQSHWLDLSFIHSSSEAIIAKDMHKVSGSEGSAAAALPVALWAEILQHVPQQQRLNQCALVCRALAPAAAQATVHVECVKIQADAIPALQTWLAVHAGQLLSLKVSVAHELHDGDSYALQLPLNKLFKLQRLQLDRINLQLLGEEGCACTDPGAGNSANSSGGSAHAAARPVLSSLQLLDLNHVQLANISSLLQLTNAPQLTSLTFGPEGVELLEPGYASHRCFDASKAVTNQVVAAVADMLQQLPRLSFLQLPGFPISDAAVQQTAAMTQLLELSFHHIEQTAPCDLQHLPSSITELQIQGNIVFDVSPSLPQRLPQLSGLLELYLHYCAVPPKVLGDFTQLKVLHLLECRLSPIEPNEYLQTEGTAALLDVLPALTRLQSLHLHLDGFDINSAAPQRFAALTASSHLTRLVQHCENRMSVPRGAVQHMFPAGRQMQLLRHISITTEDTCDGFPIEDEWCLDDADMLSIISACPQLRSLSIENSVEPGADLSVLLQLPKCCISLSVGGAAFADAAACVLTQLTQLQGLSLYDARQFTDVGLEQLIGLHLKSLNVVNCGLSKQLRVHPHQHGMYLKWDFGKMLSVSEQLQLMCDESPVLARLRRKRGKKAAAAK